MTNASSPLRYPGGKAILSGFLADVIALNGLQDGVYVEPYAGGAGAALNLLFGEHVECDAILNRKNDFIKRLCDTPVTIEEWKRQREIYRNHTRHSRIKVAFASFYLNRCNRSGIIVNGGPIGGFAQKGKWKLNARYNKDELIRRIERIHMYRERIRIYNMDALDFLDKVVGKLGNLDNTLVYLDPPYYVKGAQLYLNHCQPEDHALLAEYLKQAANIRWIMTYDNVPQIHELYSDYERIEFKLPYTTSNRRTGSELLIYSNNLIVPREICVACA